MIKPKYTVEMEPTAWGKWLVTLYEITERGKSIVRSATCPEEGQAEGMKTLWEKQFVDKKEKR